MEQIVAFAVALLPAVAILAVPRRWLKPVAIIAVLVVLYGIFWTWSFSNSCSSDGCIGIFILGGLTASVAVSAGVAGLIRRVMIRARNGADEEAG